MVSSNSTLVQAVYRGILRCARTLEDSPALKAILQIDPENLPHSSCLMLKAYLGLRDFYIPDPAQPFSIVDRIKQGSRLTRKNTTIEENLKILRFMNNVIKKGRKYNLFGHEYKNGLKKSFDVKISDQIAPGTILLAHPMLTGWFKRSVLLLVSHNESHSLGLCINKPLNMTLKDMQSKIDVAVSSLAESGTEVTLDIKGYGTLRIHPKKTEKGNEIFVPRERETRLEETVSYRETLKDAQDEIREYYDVLAEKQRSGAKLSHEEEQSLSIAQKFLNIPVTVKKIKDNEESLNIIMSTQENDSTNQENKPDPLTEQNKTFNQDGSIKSSGLLMCSSTLFENRLHNGGPVESVNILHNITSLPGQKVAGDTKFTETNDFHQWKNYLGPIVLERDNLRVFLGECTWSAGQLEDELRQGCWILCKTDVEHLDILDGKFRKQKECDLNSLWAQLLIGIGDEYAEFSRIPDEVVEPNY